MGDWLLHPRRRLLADALVIAWVVVWALAGVAAGRALDQVSARHPLGRGSGRRDRPHRRVDPRRRRAGGRPGVQGRRRGGGRRRPRRRGPGAREQRRRPHRRDPARPRGLPRADAAAAVHLRTRTAASREGDPSAPRAPPRPRRRPGPRPTARHPSRRAPPLLPPPSPGRPTPPTESSPTRSWRAKAPHVCSDYATRRSRDAWTSSSSADSAASIGGSVNASRATAAAAMRKEPSASTRWTAARIVSGALSVGRQPRADLGDPRSVVRLVGEDRHHDLGHARQQRAERRAEAAVADHRRGAGEDLRLRDPALDADVVRERAELGRVGGVADRHHAAAAAGRRARRSRCGRARGSGRASAPTVPKVT